MAQGSFHVQVTAWVRETKERREKVHRESAERIVAIMQTPRGAGGNLRVDTGFLRASLVATTGTALPMTVQKPDGPQSFIYDAGPINLVINGVDIRQPVSIVYTANYARHREYGANGHPGDRWVALAAQQWVQTVNQVCTEAQSRAGG